MPIFDQLNRLSAELGLKFLVIGGHAVCRHGYVRTTEDSDILIDKQEKLRWQEALCRAGYSVFHDGGTFLQLNPPAGQLWRLDLMLVNGETFQKMISVAVPARLDDVDVLVPCLDHLLALKLHALKHGQGLRLLKDMNDVVNLIASNRVDVRSDAFRRLVEKFGNSDLYEKIVRTCAQ